jgi:hypothetical protein
MFKDKSGKSPLFYPDKSVVYLLFYRDKNVFLKMTGALSIVCYWVNVPGELGKCSGE